jgi:hypothetical protein
MAEAGSSSKELLKSGASPAIKRIERPEVVGESSTQPSSKRADGLKTLIVPAVAVGNVGQLAVDFLCKAFGTGKSEQLDHEGNLLPCVGRTGMKSASRLTTPLEIHQLNDDISCLHIRSMVVPGKSRAMAKVILKLASEREFKRVLILGGASALALINEEQLLRTRDIPRVWGMDAVVSQEYIELEYDVNELKLAGMLPFLAQEVSSYPIKLAGLVAFVFEGDNVPDGQRMALAASKLLGL